MIPQAYGLRDFFWRTNYKYCCFQKATYEAIFGERIKMYIKKNRDDTKIKIPIYEKETGLVSLLLQPLLKASMKEDK